MNNCPNCNNQLDTKHTFCPNCGQKLDLNANNQNNNQNNYQDNTFSFDGNNQPPSNNNNQQQNNFNNQPPNNFNNFNNFNNIRPRTNNNYYNVTGLIVWSVVNLILCNMIFGIISLTMSTGINNAPNEQMAEKKYKSARLLCILGTVIGFIFNVLLFLFQYDTLFSAII